MASSCQHFLIWDSVLEVEKCMHIAEYVSSATLSLWPAKVKTSSYGTAFSQFVNESYVHARTWPAQYPISNLAEKTCSKSWLLNIMRAKTVGETQAAVRLTSRSEERRGE